VLDLTVTQLAVLAVMLHAAAVAINTAHRNR
jgi:hypothetical protein